MKSEDYLDGDYLEKTHWTLGVRQDVLLKGGLKKVEEIPPTEDSPFTTPIKIYGRNN